MRAAVLHELGATPVVEDFRAPSPDDGAVVDVEAAGLNPVDITITSGKFHGMGFEVPAVVGREAIGRADGRRVYFFQALPPFGSLAEQAAVDEGELFDVPEDLDAGLAVALGIAGMAAWLGLDARAGLEPGETVLVLGATGVAGMIGVQAAKLLGAGRVVAAGRNAEALARAEQRGADAVVRLDEAGDDLTEAIREAGGGGIDVAIDFVWGESAQPALTAMNRYGRYVQIGNAGGQEATIASAAWRRNQVGVLGHTNFAIPLPERRAVYETMAGHAAAGEIAVETETVPLDEAADAWERQRAGPRAKLVVAP